MTGASPRIVVIGAGAFGGWTAFELRQRGAAVTLLDAWGPGNVRASSGGETRVIRAGYGGRSHYTAMTLRALELWQSREREWRRTLLRRCGVLWMVGGGDGFARATAEALRAHGMPLLPMEPADAATRYPQIAFTDVSAVLLEPEAGYLLARRACETVVERFVAAGGAYRIAAVPAPVDPEEVRLGRLRLPDSMIEADAFVFACGPWLPALFPGVVTLAVTRQEVYYFGPPAGDARYSDARLPAWIDVAGDTQIYGIPGNANRGFKVADDAPGPAMDPTEADRTPTAAGILRAREFLARRFPALADAPLVDAEVCQYESTPDAELIIDRHPDAPNVWIAGGGSGHGFKMGPAVGEHVSRLLLQDGEADARFRLSRLAAPPEGGWRAKWS